MKVTIDSSEDGQWMVARNDNEKKRNVYVSGDNGVPTFADSIYTARPIFNGP
jgi:hypothetical protein